MLRVGSNKNKYVRTQRAGARFGPMRAGQNAVGVGVGDVAQVENGFTVSQNGVGDLPDQQVKRIIAENAADLTMPGVVYSDSAQLGDGIQAVSGQASDGTKLLTADIPLQGAQYPATITVSVPEVAPAPEPAQACSFQPAQVTLRRKVTIHNTAPVIVDERADVCGNAESYTEEMTRIITASEWVPVSDLNAENSMGSHFVDQNGVLMQELAPGVDVPIANNNGLQANQTLYNQSGLPLVGRRAGAYQQHRPNPQYVDGNRKVGISKMVRFRG